jgi:phenylacetate-CoA ligase
VVVTPLGVTGMPLVRFKTGDISFVLDEKCPCGRSTLRLGPVLGRKNQMLKYKGTALYPNMILSALEGRKEFHGGYVEVSTDGNGLDRVVLHAAVSDDSFTVEKIADELRSRIRVVPEIKLLSPEKIDSVIHHDNKRKKVTFVDLRGTAK